ncbi:hypothetical protein AAMO2058_001530200 [Amorphochlora amoebiformis]
MLILSIYFALTIILHGVGAKEWHVNTLLAAIFFEIQYMAFENMCLYIRLPKKVRLFGASYFAAFNHSIIVTFRGLSHLFHYWNQPVSGRMLLTSPRDIIGESVVFSASIFFGWLLYDIVHIFEKFPHLGKLDTVLHHLAFIVCTATATTYRILPFPFAWLICGEASSPFLNIRWFLINFGCGDTMAMKLTNIAFALTFFVARIILYGIGLIDLYTHYRILLKDPPGIPLVAVQSLLALILAGYVLNLFWMRQITAMALRKRHIKKSQRIENPERVSSRSTTEYEGNGQLRRRSSRIAENLRRYTTSYTDNHEETKKNYIESDDQKRVCN